MNEKSISHGIRIWAFHFQVAIPIFCFTVAFSLIYLAFFRVGGLDLLPIKGLFLRFEEFSLFEGQPMWAKIESGVFLGIAALFFLVGLVEVFSYVFLNLANPLRIMPRISNNLGHHYYNVSDQKKMKSKLLYLKNSLFYGLAFFAFLISLFCLYGVLQFMNLNGSDIQNIAFKEMMKETGIVLACTTGVFLILDFLYILFMEIHPKQKSIFEVIFDCRKVSGRQ